MRTIKYNFYACIITILFFISRATAQDYETNGHPGAHIQRTMRLLEESTPLKRNTVRILFYGQSITAQDWWKEIAGDLIKRYPNSNIIIKNRAIGGFTAPQLVKTAEFDLYPEYPDLLIFHDYGCTHDGKYEDIIRRTRERTTSEIILITHHDIGLEKNYKESELIRKIAVKYNCGLVDMERHWQEKLKETGLEYNDLLSNGPHLNDKGNEWYAGFIKEFLCYNPEMGNNEMEEFVTYISFDDDRFVKKMDDGSVEIRFTGNRIDAIPEESSCYINASPMAIVWVDDKKPSDFQEAYFITRPSVAPFVIWPAFKVLTHNTPLVVEDWTLKVLKSTPDGKKIQFRVFGSVTGEDGEGINTEKFVSNSGRIVIEGGDEWMVALALEYSHKEIPKDYKVTWHVEPHFRDLLSFPVSKFDGTDNAVTLIEGISNNQHILRLMPWSGTKLRLKGVRVYSPSFKESNPFVY